MSKTITETIERGHRAGVGTSQGQRCDDVSELQEAREKCERIADQLPAVVDRSLVVIVRDYLKLTDPAPITEQGLRAMGFVDIPNMPVTRLKLGDVIVRCTDPMLWWHAEFQYVEPQPRTMGELEQLIRRVNGGGA